MIGLFHLEKQVLNNNSFNSGSVNIITRRKHNYILLLTVIRKLAN